MGAELHEFPYQCLHCGFTILLAACLDCVVSMYVASRHFWGDMGNVSTTVEEASDADL